MVSPTLTMGGAERSLAKAAQVMYEAGVDVHIVVLRNSDRHIEADIPRGVSIWVCNGPRTLNPLSWYMLRWHLRKIKPDVVIGWSTYANFVAIAASRPWDKWRVIASERNYVPAMLRSRDVKPVRRLMTICLMRLLYPLCDVLTANSADNVRFLRKLTRNKTRCTQLPNIADLDAFELLANEFAYDRKVPNDICILSIGRLSEQKGFDILLQAMAKVRLQYDWHLVVIGDGPLGDQLRQMTQDLGLSAAVYWLGAKPNPFPYYRWADIVVVPSRFEGFPNTALEALACGCALVVSDCPTGPRELTESGKYGKLVPVGDVDALAATIVQVGLDRNLRTQLGREGREHVRRTYGNDAVKSVYLAAIGSKLSPLNEAT